MLDQKSIQGFTLTDSIKKSEAPFNQSATVRRRSGWEYTSAMMIPTKIIFTMAIKYSYELKHNYLVKRTLNL